MEGNESSMPANVQTALLDTFFPGFSLLTAAISKYLKIDITLYIPIILVVGLVVYSSQYIYDNLFEKMEYHFMSTADIRVDDEIYNMVLPYLSSLSFAKNARKFVPQTNLSSRSWPLWRWYDNDDADSDDEDSNSPKKQKAKPLKYTPSFGTHYFWYKSRLLLFKRTQSNSQYSYTPPSEREEISISCFGRNPAIVKQFLDDCRTEFLKNDENKTLIYRGGFKPGTSEPSWTRCMSRPSRPFSTVVLDEAVKQSLLDDMDDYLDPLTQRWYGNRGIPYRRGYLLYGPPGTGKSSLSFAVAGYFKLRIYIVSLNSLAMNEENLGTLFAELPKRCVVLLEDIDTAGLTHTRKPADTDSGDVVEQVPATTTTPGTTVTTRPAAGRISLSALLNVLDGVASQEGRVLIMTTNHLEKLDEALIRPGRVDMTIKFGLADTAMIKTLFTGIFTTMEGDFPEKAIGQELDLHKPGMKGLKKKQIEVLSLEEKERLEEEEAKKKRAEEVRIAALAEDFAALIPGDTFSPAEIQGFLLKHKRKPQGAISGAEQWVKETLIQKEKSKKLEKEKEEKEAKEAEEAGAKEKEEKAPKEAAAAKDDDKAKEPTPTMIAKGTMTNGADEGVETKGSKKEIVTNGIAKETLTNGIETA
jgi:chaperone BCS1